MSNSRIHIFVSGRVQGVFFRVNTREEALKLNLTGWVRNLPDSRVEILAEGEEKKLKKLLKWSKKGPFLAEVEKVDYKWENYSGEFDSFEVASFKN